MSNSYILEIGLGGKSEEKYLHDISLILGQKLQKRSSTYIGEYYTYSGLFADKFTFSKIDDDNVKIDKKNSSKNLDFIVKLTIDKGKNKDKILRYKGIKRVLIKNFQRFRANKKNLVQKV